MASMVVTRLLTAAAAGVTHARTGWPSRWTVHAPHSAMPQPNLVPVSPIASRNTHRSGISTGKSTVWTVPFTLRVITPTSSGGFFGGVERAQRCGQHPVQAMVVRSFDQPIEGDDRCLSEHRRDQPC